MRKFWAAVILLLAFTQGLVAQKNSCTDFFPTAQGTVLVNRTYDANKNLLNTVTYTIEKDDAETAEDEYSIAIRYTMTEAEGNVVDSGRIDAMCIGSKFLLKVKNVPVTPEGLKMLSTDAELVADFLDYPTTFPELSDKLDKPFDMDGAVVIVKNKKDKKNSYTSKVCNRKYCATEACTTPAGTFDCYKISFELETGRGQKLEKYYGTEWFSPGAAIVRSELRKEDGTLVSYTELAELTVEE